MDIQKEREAFSRWVLTHPDNLDITGYEENIMFDAWEAAKAQADQKIKLLLCDEHLKKCESPTGVFNSQYPDEEPCLICLAKEAKAQAVPEGFVVVPKQPTPKMIDATWNFDEEIQDMSHNSRNEFIYNAMIAAAQEPTNESE